MLQSVTVTTGARLHFGLLVMPGAGQRHFGGAGAMIDRPGFVVEARRAETTAIVAPPEWRWRLRSLVDACETECSLGRRPPPVHLALTSTIASHVGLGSGTQLALAVARALSLLAGEEGVSMAELARRVGRGARSWIGTAGFEWGGFLVETGTSGQDLVVLREPLPNEWRFVLIRPEEGAGLSGQKEAEAFSRLPPMPGPVVERLSRFATDRLVSSVVHADYEGFCEAVDLYGQSVGEYFAPIQGGIFADPRLVELSNVLRGRGWRGIGQSSWGPTLFAVCPDDAGAGRLSELLLNDLALETYTVSVAAPLNTGAAVTVHTSIRGTGTFFPGNVNF